MYMNVAKQPPLLWYCKCFLRQTKIQNNNFIFWISFIYLLISVDTPAELPPRVFNN